MPGKVRSPGNGLPDLVDYTSFESSAGRSSEFKQTRQKAKKDAHAATTELCAAGRLSEFKQARQKAKKCTRGDYRTLCDRVCLLHVRSHNS